MNADQQLVGHVLQTTIYPVKGMQGIEQEEITLKSISVVGDRTRAFYELDSTETPNFIDTIKFPGLLQYKPYLYNPSDPKNSEIHVTTPEGSSISVDSEEMIKEIQEKSGKKVTVVRMGRGSYHSMPVSLLSTASVKEIDSAAGEPIDIRRFRMNLIIETLGNTPFEEDTWLGKQLIFGDSKDGARIIPVKPDKRCATINLNPETAVHNAKILKAVVQKHANTLGVYCTIVKEGKIRKEDKIYITNIL